MTKKIFIQGIGMILTGYEYKCDPEILKARIALWASMLGDVADEDFMKAVITIVRNKPRLPGENVAAVIRQTIQEEKILTGEEAWAEVTKAISGVGYYGQPRWSSEAIEKAVNSIGWRNICSARSDQLGVLRAHFFKIYDAYKKREEIQQVDTLVLPPEVRKLLAGFKSMSKGESHERKNQKQIELPEAGT